MLIQCPECGKQFSDKATACPNCGCPTSEMNTISTTDTNEPMINTSPCPSTLQKPLFHFGAKKIGPLQIDEKSRMFRVNGVVNGKVVNCNEWFYYTDLISYELLEDDSVVTNGGLGQAAIGGLVFGGVGAIVGGITGSKTAKKKVNSINIKMTLNSLKNPCVMIPIITKPTKTDSKKYESAFNEAHKILSTLDVITRR